MSEHKMPEPVAWTTTESTALLRNAKECNDGEFYVAAYVDKVDWDDLPLYSAETVQALQSEVERLREERDALAQDAARLNWLDEDIRGPNFQWFDFDCARDYAATLRELIDAAMKASA